MGEQRSSVTSANMKISTTFLTFLAVSNAKPQSSGDPVELVNQLLLSGPLADSESAVIIDQALRYVSGELLPAIETMTSANLNSTTKALAAMDLIKLTGERGARAVTSYAEKTTNTNTLKELLLQYTLLFALSN